MQRLTDAILDCVVYLYPSESAARGGKATGGSGFLIGTPLREPVRAEEYPEVTRTPTNSEARTFPVHVYAVTNAHVIEGGNTCIRAMAAAGMLVLPTDPLHWTSHQDEDDVAVFHMGIHDAFHDFRVLGPVYLLNRALMTRLEIGLGDEIVSVGRLISHDGKQRNQPAVRFGHLSMMPGEPVAVRRERPRRRLVKQESFLVDGRSMGGYSGSPVLVWKPPGELAGQPNARQRIWQTTKQEWWLLGISWGYLFERWPVIDKKTWEPIVGMMIEATSGGMMGVVPCWKLISLLNQPSLVEQRAKKERAHG